MWRQDPLFEIQTRFLDCHAAVVSCPRRLSATDTPLCSLWESPLGFTLEPFVLRANNVAIVVPDAFQMVDGNGSERGENALLDLVCFGLIKVNKVLSEGSSGTGSEMNSVR